MFLVLLCWPPFSPLSVCLWACHSDDLFQRCFPAGLAAFVSNSNLKEVCWSSHLLFVLFKAEDMPHYSPDRCISRDLSSIQNTSRLHNSVCAHRAACSRSVKALLSVENGNKPVNTGFAKERSGQTWILTQAVFRKPRRAAGRARKVLRCLGANPALLRLLHLLLQTPWKQPCCRHRPSLLSWKKLELFIPVHLSIQPTLLDLFL